MNEDSGGGLGGEAHERLRASPPPPALTAEEEAALLAEYGVEGPYDDGIDWAAPSHFRSGLGDGHVFLTGADDTATAANHTAHHAGLHGASGTGGSVRHTDPLQLYLLDHVPSLMLPDRGTSLEAMTVLSHAVESLEKDQATSVLVAGTGAPTQGNPAPYADVLRLGKEWVRRASLTAQGVPAAALAAHLLASDSSAATRTGEQTALMPAEMAEAMQRSDDVEHRRLLETTHRLLAKAADVLAPPTSAQLDAQAAEVARAVADLQEREAFLFEDALDQHYDREEVLNADNEDEEVVRLLRQAREGRRRLCATLTEHGVATNRGSEEVTERPPEVTTTIEADPDGLVDDVSQTLMPQLPFLYAFESERTHAPAPAHDPTPPAPAKQEEPVVAVAADEQVPTLTLPPTKRVASVTATVQAWQTFESIPQLLVETQDVLASIGNTQLRDAAAEKTAVAAREAYLRVRCPASAVVSKAAHAPLRHGDRGALGLVALPTFVHQLDVLLSPTREERQQRDAAKPNETAVREASAVDGTLLESGAAKVSVTKSGDAAVTAATAVPITLEHIRRKAAIESFLIECEAAERQRMQAEEDFVEREARAAADLAVWHSEQRAELEHVARDGVVRLEEAQRTAFAELAKASQQDKGLAQQAQELRCLQETEQLAYTLMMEWEVQREQLVQDEALRFRVLFRDATADAERARAAAQQRRDRAMAAVRAAVDALRDAFEQERRQGTAAGVTHQEADADAEALRARLWSTWCVEPLLREQAVLREWVGANRKQLQQAAAQLAEAAASHAAHVAHTSIDRAEEEAGGAPLAAAPPPMDLPVHPPVAVEAAAPLSGVRMLDEGAFVRLVWPSLHAAVTDPRQAARHLAKVTLSLEDFQGVDWMQLRDIRLRASIAEDAHRLPRAAPQAKPILPATRLVEDLDLSGNPLHEVSLLDAVDAFGALRYLNLSRTELHSLDATAPSLNGFVERQRRISSDDRPSSSRSSHLRHVSAARQNAVAARLHLVSLDVSSNRLTSLVPLGTIAAASLVRCVATDNRLTSLDAVAGCLQLRELLVSHNQLTRLDAVAGLPLLRELDAGNNALTSVLPATPKEGEVGATAAARLLLLVGKLFVSHNPLTTLPPSCCSFPFLTQLFVNHAQLTALDDAALAWMPLLTVLQAEGNKIADIGGLRHCTRLQSLRLSSNRLSTLQTLAPLRCCRRLSVLDISGNPCCVSSDQCNTATPTTATTEKVLDVVVAAVYAMVPSLVELNNAPRGASLPATPVMGRRPWHDDDDGLRTVTPEMYRDVAAALCWDVAVQQMLEDMEEREAYAQRSVNRARGWEMTAQAQAADAQALAEDSTCRAAAPLNDVAAAQIHVRRAEHDRRAALYDIDTSLVTAWCATADGGAVLANVHVRHVAYAQHVQDHLERLARAWISDWLLSCVQIRRARHELQARRAAYEQSEVRRRERAARRIQPVWRGAALRSRLHRLLHLGRDNGQEDDDDAYAKVNVDDWLTEDPAALAPVELLFHDVVESARGLAPVPFNVSASALALSSGGAGNQATASLSSRGGTPAISATYTPVPPRSSGSPRGSSTTSGRRGFPVGAVGASRRSSGKREGEEVSAPASEVTTLEEQWGPRVAAQIRKKQQKSTRSHQQHMRQEFLQDPLRVKRELREDHVQHRPK